MTTTTMLTQQGGRMNTRILTVVAMAALTVSLLAGAVSAQETGDYPPQEGPVVVADVVVTTPGGTIRISGRDWGPGTTVQFIRNPAPGVRPPAATGSGSDSGGEVLGTATVADDGTFTAEVTVPADAEPGDFTVVARGADKEADEVTERPVVLSVVEASALSGAGVGAGVDEDAGFLTTGNAILALLVVAAIALLLFGPVRRRKALTR